MQPDGKVVVGGNFHSMLGTPCTGIARLNTNGNLDGVFYQGIGYPYTLNAIVAQPDGKLLLASKNFRYDCDESHCDQVSDFMVTRLNANGSVDSSFIPATGSGTVIYSSDGNTSIVVQPDGKILIGGSFTSVNGTNRNHIARLNADGSLDSSFNPGTGANGIVRSLALQPDGKVLVGGDFTTVNGVVRPHVARLFGNSVVPSSTLNIARSDASMILSWPVTTLNFQLQESTNLSLPNSWSPVAQPAVTSGAQISVTVPGNGARKFFRLKSQ